MASRVHTFTKAKQGYTSASLPSPVFSENIDCDVEDRRKNLGSTTQQ